MNAQIPRDSRYYRPRRALSWGALIFGILAGLAGGLYWAWQVAPVEETDTAPWQLNAQSRANYVVAIMVNYGYDSGPWRGRIAPARPAPAGRSGAVRRRHRVRLGALRLRRQRQRRARDPHHDDVLSQSRPGRMRRPTIPLFVGPTPTPQSTVFEIPTLPPPPTKTATPPPDPNEQGSTPVRVVPTVAPQGAFDIVRLERFCDADTPGIIVVQVQERDGTPLPGQRVRASWRDGRAYSSPA
ncbi:MAG: hypothetical protein HND48_05535 [Chloroflexi bacterium]|nr:hypothetical protein [Chloroflexota bacterium]